MKSLGAGEDYLSVMRDNLKALGVPSRSIVLKHTLFQRRVAGKRDSRFTSNVSFSYKKTRVLSGVNLGVHQR